MNGPVVILLLCFGGFVGCMLFLKVDAWLTEREYQRRIRGDESRRYADARRAVARQQAVDRVRIGRRK